MLHIRIIYKDNESLLSFEDEQITVGKNIECDIQIKGWLIASQHAAIKKLPAGYVIEDLDRGANGTYVNDNKIDMYGPLEIGDKINIGKYSFYIESIEGLDSLGSPKLSSNNDVLQVDIETIEPSFLNIDQNSNIDKKSERKPIETGLTEYRDTRAELEQEMRLMKQLHSELIETMDLERQDISKMSDKELYESTLKCLNRIKNLNKVFGSVLFLFKYTPGTVRVYFVYMP